MSQNLATLGTFTADPLALIARSRKLADSTKGRYTTALGDYLATGGDIGDAQALTDHADGLSESGRRFLSAAVTMWAKVMIRQVKSQSTPSTVNAVRATVDRCEAMMGAIEVSASKGQKPHTWLSLQQVKSLENSIGNGSIKADRDRAAIGLLVSAGLRREEAVTITFDDILLKPVGERMRAVLSIVGKGGKRREVPISTSMAAVLDKWGIHVGHKGRILRSINQRGEPGESLSATGLFELVRKFGGAIGHPKLAPHDLRRTYAQLGHEAGTPIPQLSVLLGHASIETTKRYLNLDLDLKTTASDFIPWG